VTDVWRAPFARVPRYLNTATVGIPPQPAVAAMHATLENWRLGRLDPHSFDPVVDRARAAWARLAGVGADQVSIGSSVSSLAGLVAASIPDGTRVLLAEGDFTSVLFPFAAQQGRGVTVRAVPLEHVVDAVDDTVDLIAVSAVQSADGRLVDVPALTAAAAVHDARVLLDVTQALGWLPVELSTVDYVVCAAYKWLLCPRGVAFLAVRPDRLESITPHAAGWYAGADIWNSIYGLPLRLSDDARRLDTSPDWFAFVGAVHSLELLAAQDMAAVRAHNVTLANAFLAGLGERPRDSAIVSIDVPGAAESLAAARVSTAVRGGKVRASFHLYNDDVDVAAAVAALRGTMVR
jgi:selenocysteine lyase/cysteine desulfurase